MESARVLGERAMAEWALAVTPAVRDEPVLRKALGVGSEVDGGKINTHSQVINFAELGRAEAVNLGVGMDTGLPEDFVGVFAADPGNRVLVHQHIAGTAAFAPDGTYKFALFEIEQIRAKVFFGFYLRKRPDIDFAQVARVGHNKGRSGIKFEANDGLAGWFGTGLEQFEFAGETEVEY
jgi:hypothetical protein